MAVDNMFETRSGGEKKEGNKEKEGEESWQH